LNRYETDCVVTVDEALELLEQVGSGALGVLFDTFHANIEEPQFAHSIERAATTGRLFHVHLGDSNRLAPGWGHIDFAEIVRSLQDAGYQGYVSAELFPLPTPDAAAEQTLRTMRMLIPQEMKESTR
jgi:sugar phosphate isomerase/epimerase